MRTPLVMIFIIIISMSLACSACSAEPAFTPTATPGKFSGELTPYFTPTTSSTPTPLPAPSETPVPPPSATPVTHTVQKGEEMFGIALLYGITLDALRAANPEVDPNFLRVGEVLIIPSQGSTTESTAGLPTPLPLNLVLSSVYCVQDATAGAWCYLQVTNDTDSRVQGVSVQVSLRDEQGNVTVSQSSAAPLDLLQPKASLPVAIYFSPPLPMPIQADAKLLTAYPVTEDDTHYLDLHAENVIEQERMNGLAADISGDLMLDASDTASLLWVLAVAYDSNGVIIGIRRWESPSALGPDQSMPFIMRVYSSSAEINHVEIITEAHR